MRLLPIQMIKPGMKLGKAIYSEDGKTLLGYHVELTQGLIDKLRKIGYQQLYVEDSRTDDIYIEEALLDETIAAVKQNLIQAYQQLQNGGFTTPLERLKFSKNAQQSVKLIVDELESRYLTTDDTVMLLHSNRRNYSPVEHFFQNALHVCVYATRIALLERFPKDDMRALAMGALFHDIGNAQISPKLLQKASALTPLEFIEVQKHTEYGFQLLKEMPGIPLLAAHCALQHHEKTDGTGYPFALMGSRIHPYAQWVSILDAYDAMTNPRPYRPAFSPDHALELLFIGSGSLYPKEKVEFFRNKMAIYPIGVSVRLSSGEIGIVSSINKSMKHRPTVRVLTNPAGEEMRVPYEIDLSRHLHIMIHRVGEDALVH